MKKTTHQPGGMAKWYCRVFGHQYDVSKHVTRHVKEYTCTCCKKQLTTDSSGKLTELTPTYAEINAVLSAIRHKRSTHRQPTLAHSAA